MNVKETKWRYLYLRDPLQLQTWLEDLSLEGWRLEKIRGNWGRFRRTAPRRIRYRLEPKRAVRNGGGDIQEKEQLYRDMGWEKVGTALGEFRLYAAADPDAPELHTDPEILKGLWRRERNRMLLLDTVLLGMFLVGLLRLLDHLYWSTYHILVRVSWAEVALVAVMVPVLLISFWYSWVKCRPYRRLCRGEQDPYRPYPTSWWSRWRPWLADVLVPLLIVVPTVVALVVSWNQMKRLGLPLTEPQYDTGASEGTDTGALLYVDPEDLGAQGEIGQETYIRQFDTVAAVYYNEVFHTYNSGDGSTLYWTEYYHMRSAYWTQLLVERILDQAEGAEALPSPDDDGMWAWEDTAGYRFLLAWRGNQVVHLSCGGDVERAAQADAAVALLDRAAY